MAKSDRLYGDSPKMGRGDDGKVGVIRPSKAEKVSAGIDGMPTPVHQVRERREMAHRHAHERLALHHAHEMEHEHGRADMGRHVEELGAMHDRHHKEHKAMLKRHGMTGEKMAETVEDTNDKD